MATAEDVCRWIDVTLTPQQRAACRFLEREGLRFCVEFGYGNAVEIARQRWNARRRSARAALKQARAHLRELGE